MEKACTFIGHKDCCENIYDDLYIAIEKLIVEDDVLTFYVGTHGSFDKLVYRVLIQLEKKYKIKVIVVLAYMNIRKENIYYDIKKTIFPDVLETTPLRFAINKRNDFMIKNSQYMICYVNNTFSNSYKYIITALKKNLKIINLGNQNL